MISYFPYYGGKSRMVKQILSALPTHIKEWYELFGGSGVVTINKPDRHSVEVINDLNPYIANLHKVMSDAEKGKELLSRLCSLTYSKGTYMRAERARNYRFSGMSDIDKAVEYFVLLTQSFNATMQSFRTGVSTEAYRAKLLRNLPKVYERLQGVKVMNEDALNIISKIADNPNAFAYMDVPYRQELRGKGAENVYVCEMSTIIQYKMLNQIRNVKCCVLLCGYRSKVNDLYDRMLLPYGWHSYKIAELVKTCQTKEKRDIGEEWIWVNFDLPDTAKKYIKF